MSGAKKPLSPSMVTTILMPLNAALRYAVRAE